MISAISARLPVSCSVLPVDDLCNCGSKWTRKPHHVYELNECVCMDCSAVPSRYILRVKIAGSTHEFRYDKIGRPFRTVHAAVSTSKQIYGAIEEGTFKRSSYRRSFMYETLSEFINGHVVKVNNFNEEEKEFLQDFMAPYFTEVGVFAACGVHLNDFINTFKLKGERKDMAQRLFEKVTAEISI